MGHFDLPEHAREVGNLGEVGPVTGGEHNAVRGHLRADALCFIS